MKETKTLIIEPVSNGWIVRPAPQAVGYASKPEETLVFIDVNALGLGVIEYYKTQEDS